MHSWAMPADRDQRYRTDTEYRNANAGLKQLTTGRNADTG